MHNQPAVIAMLNDRFRTTFRGGHLMITSGVHALGQEAMSAILAKVRTHRVFEHANDPNREHDFGVFEHAGRKLFWKIDYFDESMRFGSEDPADPFKTVRVLTIMLADEY